MISLIRDILVIKHTLMDVYIAHTCTNKISIREKIHVLKMKFQENGAQHNHKFSFFRATLDMYTKLVGSSSIVSTLNLGHVHELATKCIPKVLSLPH